MKAFLNNYYALTKLYWQDKKSKYDWFRLLVIVILTIFDVYLNTQFNEWKNAFYTALQNYNSNQVIVELIRFCKLAAINIVVLMYIYYLQQIVVLNWRSYLSEYFIDRWLHNNNFYRSNLEDNRQDNPDQRVGEDIKLFIEKSLKFTIGVLNAGLTVVLFVNILWKLSGVIPVELLGYKFKIHGYIVWLAFLYSLIGTYCTHKLGKKLNFLNYVQQKYEADFRYAMMRLREFAEGIAMFKGYAVERKILVTRLHKVLKNFNAIILKERQITAFRAGFYQSASIIPVLIAVPLYMKRTINLGGLMQSASAFSRVTASLAYFVRVYTDFAEWQSVVGRLHDFRTQLERLENSGKERSIAIERGGSKLVLTNLELQKPNGELLLKVPNLEFEQGSNVLLSGENGLGKSTLMRTLAGIWPYYTGRIVLPEPEKLMFLSQRPYLPLGSLASCIAYPAKEMKADVQDYLREFNLEYLIDKLDVEADWSNILSLGEQQKIAIIRVLLAKPEWVFLDEATSNMDKTSEDKTYELLSTLKDCTIVSIGHGPELEKYHNQLIKLQ